MNHSTEYDWKVQAVVEPGWNCIGAIFYFQKNKKKEMPKVECLALIVE